MTDPAMLHAVTARALEWLYTHRDRFRLEPDAGAEVPFMDRFKPLGELALICSILRREAVTGTRQTSLARQVVDHAWSHILDGGNVLVLGQRDEPISPIPFEVYLPFHEMGYRSPVMDRAIRLNHRLSGWGALETRPNRRLGLSAAQLRYGLRPSTPLSETAATTWLAHTPEPWTLEETIGYDVTHTVFHLTGWGANPEDLPPTMADYLQLWLPVFLDDLLELRRWDLLGEFLAVDACLPSPTLDHRAWAGFAAAQQPDGAMPAVDTMPTGDPDDVFDIVYHPTLVAVLAATLATSRALTRLSNA
ncbi:DUF6895 family protein [Pseudonocardia spinosispora]|uniref:DUF6895 family protein n=1 Tax=Pseudonocardia spinosispora TaxID=103441 RepID=UPI0003F97602|nr:hypothetical protein [Pseudonocardia spinosispora]